VKRLFIESWERDGKKGYSISLSVKGGSSVSVACSKEELLALAEWMKELNVLLRYAELERVESEGEEEKGEVQEAVEAEGENVDIEDLDIEDIEF
jgi:molybdenum cofactor biosynthesis enzyme MoaA